MIICPFCQEEVTPLKDGTCPECGCYLLKEKQSKEFLKETFEETEEDDWTASDWGEDIEVVAGMNMSNVQEKTNG